MAVTSREGRRRPLRRRITSERARQRRESLGNCVSGTSSACACASFAVPLFPRASRQCLLHNFPRSSETRLRGGPGRARQLRRGRRAAPRAHSRPGFAVAAPATSVAAAAAWCQAVGRPWRWQQRRRCQGSSCCLVSVWVPCAACRRPTCAIVPGPWGTSSTIL